jgi:hypothetical protein
VCGRCQPHICDRQLRRPVVRRSRRNNCKRCSGGRSWRGAMSSFTFAIVAKSDNPIYELVVSPKKEEPTVNQQNQFFLHAVRSTHTCFASLRVTLTPVLLLLGPPQGAGHCRRGALEDQQHVSQGMYPSEHAPRNQQCLSSAPQTVCDPNAKLQSSRLRIS